MPRISATRVKCPNPDHIGARVKLDGTYGTPVTAGSATSAHRGRASRTSSSSCFPVRSRGTAPVSTASARSSGAKVQKRRTTTSSLPAGSPRHSPPSVLALPTCTPHALPELGPGVSVFDPEAGEVRESAHGQLADWVELFAPVLFDAPDPVGRTPGLTR